MASAITVANRAGLIIRDVMAKGDLGIVEKVRTHYLCLQALQSYTNHDCSLVTFQAKNDLQTEADRLAQNCIIASLSRQFPAMRIIGEEGELDAAANAAVPPEYIVREADVEFGQRTCPPAYAQIREEDLVVWVDPLDGTAEYARGYVEHVTVLIGVAYKDEAIGGIIHQPFYSAAAATDGSPEQLGRTIWGVRGLGAGGFSDEKALPLRDGIVVTTTRSHCTDLVRWALDALHPREILRVGGAGFKVLQLLEGQAHAYVFASPGCKKWDTCAPEAVLAAHGGRLTTIGGTPYRYGANVGHPNLGGVLATAPGVDHDKLVAMLPDALKEAMP